MSIVKYIQPIFSPTQDMFERNVKSIESFFDYYSKNNYSFDCIFGGYAHDVYWNRLKSIILDRKPNATVARFDKNYGKAYVVNKLVKDFAGYCDYFLTADSDIQYDIDQPNMIARLVEAFNMLSANSVKTSLIALQQTQNNCHIMEQCDRNKYQYNGSYGVEEICHPPGEWGVAGGCLFISMDAWIKLNGYRTLGVYAGDDAHLMRDSYYNGYRFILSKSISCIHPYETDEDYQKWKIDICTRSNNLEKAMEETNKYWESKNV